MTATVVGNIPNIPRNVLNTKFIKTYMFCYCSV